jgi:hypothetical protein
MTFMLVFAVVSILLLLALLWTVREGFAPRPFQSRKNPAALEELFPLHCRHFPQVQQALSPSDAEYLELRASPKARRRALTERRAVVREFLQGLREDFRRIEQLGRAIAALSPEVHRVEEWARLRLAMRFELLCLGVEARLWIGGISISTLKRLTDLVGAQAAQMEAAITAMHEMSLRSPQANFSA